MFSWIARLFGVASDARARRVPLPKRLIPEAARKVMEHAETMTLYSLDPTDLGDDTQENFHRWRVLGSIAVECPNTRTRIATQLVIANEQSNGGMKCFDPTHGIRVTWQGQVVDLLACFWCSQLEVFGPSEEWGGIVPVAATPARLLDRLLRQAGVPLAKPPKL